jgi:peroxiredoxin family protein/rhodanese-related sulfurtransferase
VLADAPEFEGRLYAWATASGAKLERVLSAGGQTTADILLIDESLADPVSAKLQPPPVSSNAPAMPLVVAPSTPTAMEPIPGPQIPPREHRATLLVLRNDYETLLSALMVANSSASQGMAVEVYFAFWGINLLRGEKRRKSNEKQPGFLQRMMRWMMPRGPRRQQLSKMHWGGLGKFLLELFMRQRSVLSLEQLLQETEKQGVQLKVCTMSMGVMGIQKADLMELPNLSFGGVTSFSEAAGRSSFSLVFLAMPSSISPVQAAALQRCHLIDIRPPEERAVLGVLPGSVGLLPGETIEECTRFDETLPILLACTSGKRSAALVESLGGDWRGRVFNLQGGVLAWQAEGLPTCNVSPPEDFPVLKEIARFPRLLLSCFAAEMTENSLNGNDLARSLDPSRIIQDALSEPRVVPGSLLAMHRLLDRVAEAARRSGFPLDRIAHNTDRFRSTLRLLAG